MRNVSSPEEAANCLKDLLTAWGRRQSLRDPMAYLVEEIGITPAQLHALMWVGRDKELSMGDLATRIGVTVKTVTGVVDRLEREGLASRGRLDTDRRVVMVFLTDAGRKRYRQIDKKFDERMVHLLSLMPVEDRESLLRIMKNLLNRMDEARKK